MLRTDKRNNAIGMASRMLRRHGFRREKGKDIFSRHTIGLGGIYVFAVEDGYIVRIAECRAFVLADTVTDLRKHIEELDQGEHERANEWTLRIKNFGAKKDET